MIILQNAVSMNSTVLEKRVDDKHVLREKIQQKCLILQAKKRLIQVSTKGTKRSLSI